MGNGQWLNGKSRRFFVVMLLLSFLCQGRVYAERIDSLAASDCAFRWPQLVAPAALVTVGTVGVSAPSLCRFKRYVRSEFEDWRGDKRFHADDYLEYLPAVCHLGLGPLGVSARHPFRERVAAQATAWIAMVAMVNATKYTMRERRPDGSARNSFPSGHTATAFMGAELVREEYGNWYGTGAYLVAGSIAFLRLYNDRHWVNDVVGGAGVGILAARVGYWLLPLERRLFRWDKRSDTAILVPAYEPSSRALSLNFAAAF